LAGSNEGFPGEAPYAERSYRNRLFDRKLVSFQVLVKETDLYIQATHDLRPSAHYSVLRHRYQMEQYLSLHPWFLSSLTPLPDDEFAPPVIREMIQAGQNAGVGPMAAVAGAMAEAVGKELLPESPDVIVENGGDIFIFSSRELKVGIFAGKSPLSFHVGLRVPATAHGWGVCTSSGTVGPSLSFGRADAVCVVSPSAPLSDAAATAIGNLVHSPADLSCGLKRAQNIEGLTGVVIIIKDKLGAWGEIELIEI
jgi:ApbE superfamily uncharacterized protein (UPF0280 family)